MKRIGYFGPWYGSRPAAQIAFQLLADAAEIGKTDGYELVVSYADQLGIDLTRNAAMEWARAEGFDYLVMQDADTYAVGVAPIMPMVLALEETGAAVVAAPYPLRRGEQTLSVVPVPNGPGLYEAEYAGTGLMVISVAEIERIAKDYDGPWFARTYQDKRQSKLHTGGDVWFCDLIRNRGGMLIVHPEIPTAHDHLMSRGYSPDAEGNGGAPPDEATE